MTSRDDKNDVTLSSLPEIQDFIAWNRGLADPLVQICFEATVYEHAIRIRAAFAPSHVASSGDGKLTEPAWIGNTSFGVGCSERTVIERAQREFKYQTAPEREKERIERGAKALAEFQASLSTTPRSAHHDAEVRKHWDYLVGKYADLPPRLDTSNEIANVINDASNLAAGVRRYAASARGTSTSDQRDALLWLQQYVFSGEVSTGRPHDRYARSCIQEVLNNMEGGVTAEPAIKGALRPTDGGKDSNG